MSGVCNNLSRAKFASGAAFTIHPRLGGILYPDGVGEPTGASRPNPRVISNEIVKNSGPPIPSADHINFLTVMWGQIVDHELTFFQERHPGSETMHIPVPTGDPVRTNIEVWC